MKALKDLRDKQEKTESDKLREKISGLQKKSRFLPRKSLKKHSGYPYHLRISNRRRLPSKTVVIDVHAKESQLFMMSDRVEVESYLLRVLRVEETRKAAGNHFREDIKWQRLTCEVIYNYFFPEQYKKLEEEVKTLSPAQA